MFIKIPFEKEIEFKTNISEITKMSLENDYNITNDLVLGNFYISGEYRIHEVSVNTDSFNYTLPFEVSLQDDVNKDSLEFNIEDFSYDIVDNNKLKVNIEFSLKGELVEKKNEFEQVDERELENELTYIDEFLDKENMEEEVTCEDTKEFEEEVKTDEEKLEEEVEEIKEKDEEERLDENEEKMILDSINDSDDTFVTYHIHIVKDNETIESICSLYNVPSSLISEYNEIDNISSGDKILIPKIDE